MAPKARKDSPHQSPAPDVRPPPKRKESPKQKESTTDMDNLENAHPTGQAGVTAVRATVAGSSAKGSQDGDIAALAGMTAEVSQQAGMTAVTATARPTRPTTQDIASTKARSVHRGVAIYPGTAFGSPPLQRALQEWNVGRSGATRNLGGHFEKDEQLPRAVEHDKLLACIVNDAALRGLG